MHQVRQPAVAGAFYHSQKHTLANDVQAMLEAAQLQAKKSNVTESKESEIRLSQKRLLFLMQVISIQGQPLRLPMRN